MFRFAAFSSIWSLISAPAQLVWRMIVRFFPERDFVIMSGGNIKSFRQSSFWYFTRTFGKLVLIVWAFWATYTFIYHRPMLQARTRQLEESRTQHAMQMSYLDIYNKEFIDLTRELNVTDDQILNNKKLSSFDTEVLMTKRVNTWAQLDFLHAKLKEMLTDSNFKPEIQEMADLSLEYELAREENLQLRAQNAQMEDSFRKIHDADAQIVATVTQLAKEKTDVLSKEMKKISGTLASLGLNEKELAARAIRISNPTVGAALPPIAFIDKDIDPKYQELADKIELWQGLSRSELMLPIGAPVNNPNITSTYGNREHPVNGIIKKHTGIDFAGQVGTPLYSVAPGRIIFVGEYNGYGNTVEIDHGLGFTTLYAHLSKPNVTKGEWVDAKQVVGFGGSSGLSTGPHLHYEIRYKNSPFNPYTFIKGDIK